MEASIDFDVRGLMAAIREKLPQFIRVGKYNPNQPRDPQGSPTGGQWTSTGGESGLPADVLAYGAEGGLPIPKGQEGRYRSHPHEEMAPIRSSHPRPEVKGSGAAVEEKPDAGVTDEARIDYLSKTNEIAAVVRKVTKGMSPVERADFDDLLDDSISAGKVSDKLRGKLKELGLDHINEHTMQAIRKRADRSLAEWDESKHPRVPEGNKGGGQFTDGDGNEADTEQLDHMTATALLKKLNDGVADADLAEVLRRHGVRGKVSDPAAYKAGLEAWVKKMDEAAGHTARSDDDKRPSRSAPVDPDRPAPASAAAKAGKSLANAASRKADASSMGTGYVEKKFTGSSLKGDSTSYQKESAAREEYNTAKSGLIAHYRAEGWTETEKAYEKSGYFGAVFTKGDEKVKISGKPWKVGVERNPWGDSGGRFTYRLYVEHTKPKTRGAQEADKNLRSLSTATGRVRRDMLLGEPHLVVPVTALVEGVVFAHGATTPEFVPASSFGRVAKAWDVRPVMAGHPQDENGVMISAADPRVLDQRHIGWTFGTRMGRKLEMEAWINERRARAMGGDAEDIVRRLNKGEQIEVSIGAHVDIDGAAEGEYQGRAYRGAWRSTLPDHLAFLKAGDRGACSIEMGCGAQRSAAEWDESKHPRHPAGSKEGGQFSGGDAGSGGAYGSDNPNIKVVDPDTIYGVDKYSHEGGLTSEDIIDELSQLPMMDKAREGFNQLHDEDLEEFAEILTDARHGDHLGPDSEAGKWLKTHGIDPGDLLIDDYMAEALDTVLNDVRNSGSNLGPREEDEDEDDGERFNQLRAACDGKDHTTNADGATIHTDGTPCACKGASTTNRKDTTMDDARIKALIASPRNHFTDKDTAFLKTLSDAQFTALEASDKDAQPLTIEKRVEVPAPTPRTAQEFLATVPEGEMRDLFADGLRTARARKDGQVAQLVALGAKRCPYTKEQLDAMSINDLDRLVALAGIEQPSADASRVDFSGLLPRAAADADNKDNVYTNPPDPYAAPLKALQGGRSEEKQAS